MKRVAHQSEEDEKELDDIGVSDGIESAEERVENSDACRQDDTDVDVNVDDDADRRSCFFPQNEVKKKQNINFFCKTKNWWAFKKRNKI